MNSQRIAFVGASYEARSLNADAQRAINCYVELDNASPRAPLALYGTPGTVTRLELGAGPVRGAITQGDEAFFVSGTGVYKVTAALASTLLGNILTNSGPVGLASNGTEVLIVDGSGGWLATTAALAPITDPDFPTGVTQATYQGGFFIVTGDGSQRFYINEIPNSGADWNGTDFASAEGSPDNTVTGISDHFEVWFFGSSSAEVFVQTSDSDQVFQRSGNVFLEIGTASAGSVRAMDNTLYWLGRDQNGAGGVFKAQGYSPVRISTHALEKAIQGYAVISDAGAFTYQQDGHSFYVLTFPTADKTWVYDAATGLWHERAWRDPATGALHRWRANCHVFFAGLHLVGDWQTGAVYSLDLDTYTDAENPILRLRATQCLDSGDGSRLFFEEVQVDMETGVGISVGQGSAPLLMLRYSNDGGHTWSNYKTKSIGAQGAYGARVKFGPTGAGRDRVWEVSMTDPVKFAVLGAFCRYSRGDS